MDETRAAARDERGRRLHLRPQRCGVVLEQREPPGGRADGNLVFAVSVEVAEAQGPAVYTPPGIGLDESGQQVPTAHAASAARISRRHYLWCCFFLFSPSRLRRRTEKYS